MVKGKSQEKEQRWMDQVSFKYIIYRVFFFKRGGWRQSIYPVFRFFVFSQPWSTTWTNLPQVVASRISASTEGKVLRVLIKVLVYFLPKGGEGRKFRKVDFFSINEAQKCTSVARIHDVWPGG